MREPDAVTFELDDTSFTGGRQTVAPVDAGRRFHQARRGVREGGGREQIVAARLRKGEHAPVHELVKRVRHGQSVTRLHGDARTLEHPHELERIERVASRGLMDLGEQRPWERDPELLQHDAMESAQFERAYLDLAEAIGRKRPAHLRHDGALRSFTLGEQETDRLERQPSRGVRESSRRGSIEPLDVVHRNELRPGLGKRPKRIQDGHAHRARIRGCAFDLLEDEGAGERAPLSRWQRSKRFVENGIEKIAEPGEAERHLALRGSGAEHADAACCGVLNAGVPERRLPHSRLAFEDERRRRFGEACDEASKRSELRIAAGNGSRHGHQIVRLRTSLEQPLVNTPGMGYSVLRASELEWEPRGDEGGRTIAQLSEALTQSRANIWRYPVGARGKRHADPVQEEVFVVMDGTLTVDLGEPPERHELERGSVLVVEPRTPLQLRNAGSEELVLFIYGAPPERGQAEFFDDVPD